MEQGVIAGIGNVYRCEVLFRHRINPMTPGQRLKRESWELIWADLRRLLPLGVATSRIVTVDEEVAEIESALAKGEDVHLDERTSYVYKRTGQDCLRCGSQVRAKDVAGRTLYWCGNCQRRS
jgi:endonuclease-8